MYVLQLCHSYYPPFLDCARQYAALFKNSQYRLITVFLTGNPDMEIAKGVEHGEVEFLGFESREVSGLKLQAIKKISGLHRRYNFVFCIAHRVKPTYVALLATDTSVISVHHNYNDYSRWSRRFLVNFYRDRLLMLGVSDSVRDDLRRDLRGWSAKRIQTFYNRIDVDAVKASQINRKDARDALGIPQNAWVVGNVGRLHHDKDQVTLIRGFEQALPDLPPESLLLIIGAGPWEGKLKAQVAASKASHAILFLGNVPQAARYFKAFDVFALTSDHEPFGMVLLEAMAANVPIICSDCGGGAEVAKEIGLLFPLGNARVLANKILEAFGQSNRAVSRIDNLLMSRFSDDSARIAFWHDPALYKLIDS